MKGKRKILAILIILLLITVPLGIVQASETNSIDENQEKIPIEIATLDTDEIVNTKTIYLSEQEITEIENTVSVLMDRIQSAQSWQEIKTIINNMLGGNKLGIFSIVKSLLSRIISFRTYVISSGHSYKISPIRKGSIKIRKKIVFWHYISGGLFKDRTIILKPLALKLRVLKGSQIGMISRFTGVFFYVARKIPQKSYTFFIGFAKRANGIQIPNGN